MDGQEEQAADLKENSWAAKADGHNGQVQVGLHVISMTAQGVTCMQAGKRRACLVMASTGLA